MEFKWRKRGLIFSPNGHSEWMFSHAQCPFTHDLGDRLRVYFSTREDYKDGMSRAHGGWVDLDKSDMRTILAAAEEPMIDLGGVGEFDEFGSMPNSIVKVGDTYMLYFCGWTRSVSTPYSWEIGLATGTDAKRFQKVGRGPIIGPTLHEPYLHACPQVYRLAEDDWHMFYLSGQRWLWGGDKYESQYLLVHATSKDGIEWRRDPRPIIEPAVEHESQTSAAIIELDGMYYMFFSYRHGLNFRHERDRGYRIGCAWSRDLFGWVRDDSMAGIDVSDDGWDSDMVAYPHIARVNGRYYMFYCGNDFGREGFGLAELDPDLE